MGTLFFAYRIPAGAGPNAKGVFVIGRFQFIQVLQALGTFALGLVVLLRGRRVAPATVRSQLALMIVGSALILFGGALMFANLYDGSLPFESLLSGPASAWRPFIAVPLVHYRGLLEGQLLRSDLKASLLAAVWADEPVCAHHGDSRHARRARRRARLVVLAVFVLGDELRALGGPRLLRCRTARRADRPAHRRKLRRLSRALDFDSLSPGQSAELVDCPSALTAPSSPRRALRPRAQRLELLARKEFAPVRDALGLAAAWRPRTDFLQKR